MEQIENAVDINKKDNCIAKAEDIFRRYSSADFGGDSDNNFGSFKIKHELKVGTVKEYERTKGRMYSDIVTLYHEDVLDGLRSTINLLFVPEKTEAGYIINNTNKQVVSLYKRAPGWYIKKSKELDRNGEPKNVTIEYIVNSNTVLVITVTATLIKVSKGKKSSDLTLGTFLRAITRSSFDEIISKLGISGGAMMTCMNNDREKTGHMSIAECIDKSLEVLEMRNPKDKRDVYDNYNRLMRILSPYGKFKADQVNRNRLESLISFRNRAINKTLVGDLTFTYRDEDNNLVTESLRNGSVLTSTVLEKIDKSAIDTLQVEYLGSTYKLKKYPIPIDDKGIEIFSPDEIFTIVNIAISFLNGYPLVLNEFELTTRLVQDLDGAVCNQLENTLTVLNDRLSSLTYNYDDDSTYNVSDIFNTMMSMETSPFSIVQRVSAQDSKDVQTSDIDNIIAFESKNSKIMMEYGGRGSDNMTKVQDLQSGRLDPIDQPESSKIGTVHNMAYLAKINNLGELTSPYLKVTNGIPDKNNVIYLTASEEENKYIAEWNETFETDRVKARIDGKVLIVDKSQIDYMQYCPVQDMSLARALIPFQNHNAAKRNGMATNHFKQAEIPIKNERPLVSTGVASISEMGIFTAKKILTDYWNGLKFKPSLTMEEFINQELELKTVKRVGTNRELTFEALTSKDIIVKSLPFVLPTSAKTFFMYKINASRTNKYKGSDIVAYNSGTSIKQCKKFIRADYGSLEIPDKDFTVSEATGVNLRVGFKTMESSTVDDAIVISDRLLYDGVGTSLVVSHLDYELKKSSDGTRIESFSRGNLNGLDYITSAGLPKIGTYLKHGDVYMTIVKEVYKFDEITNKMNLVGTNVIEKRIENYVEGKVIYAEQHDTSATVLIAHNAEIEEGDKWSGRHGNKGVTARIVPAHQMPYTEDGEPLDLILNPLGIPSRMNIGQVFEVNLSEAMKRQDLYAIVSPYFPDDLAMLREQMKITGITPQYLYDGRTGKKFKRPMMVGYIHMQKLVHRVSKKITARGIGGKTDQVTLQPTKGKGVGGQSIGEMETFILDATNCKTVLQECFTFQSDNLQMKDKAISLARSNIYNIQMPESENVNDKTIQAFQRILGLEMSYENGEVLMEPLTNDVITSMGTKIEIRNSKELQDPEKFGNTFVTSNGDYPAMRAREIWHYIELNTEIVHPMWLYQDSPLYKLLFVNIPTKEDDDKVELKTIGKERLRLVKERKLYVDTSTAPFYTLKTPSEEITRDCYTGVEAICKLIRNIDIDEVEKIYLASLNDFEEKNLKDKVKEFNIMEIIDRLKEKGFNPEDYIIKYFPILPRIWRPQSPIENVVNDFDRRYEAIGRLALSLKEHYDLAVVDNLYNEIIDLLGISKNESSNGRKDLQTITKYYVGKDITTSPSANNDHALLRGHILAKRIDMSARSVIIPQADMNRKPYEVGVPLYIACKIYEVFLLVLLEKLNAPGSPEDYDKILDLVAICDRSAVDEMCGNGFYDTFIEEIEYFLSTRIVIFGRQPSLHNSSIRAYKPYLVFTKAIQIHPLVCSAYNADFDGDQMWLHALLSDKAQEEAWNNMSVYKGIISPKDSSCLLDHSQDSLLGMYYGTMLYDNVTTVTAHPRYFEEGNLNYFIYNDIDQLELDIDTSNIELQDLVIYKHTNGKKYMSTAGRILLNSKLPDAFTEDSFTNPIGIPIEQKTINNLCDMRYDKLFCKNKTGAMVSQSVKELNLEIYRNHSAEDAVEYYHAMMVYGLKYSDMSGISITLDDIEAYKYSNEYFRRVKVLEDEINRDFDCGMITEEEKKKSIIAVYKELTSILKKRVMSEFPRNNNLFIMFESGARGSEGQILQTVGVIGITAKTSSEELETPIATSYAEGLSCFDTFLSSFSGRASIKSTQYGAADSGYATRQATYMAGGFKVEEYDCGKEIAPLKMLYTFANHVTLVEADGTVVEKDLKEDDANLMIADLFGNKRVLFDDDMKKHYAKFLQGNGILERKAIKVLLKNRVREIKFRDGSIMKIKYSLEPMLKDLLLNREVSPDENLPSLITKYYITQETIDYINSDFELSCVFDEELNVGDEVEEIHKDLIGVLPVKYATKGTIKYIEDNNLDTVKIRLFIDCETESGCCARCYGLKFDTNKLPLIGESIGIIAAQSIGEPSTQLTMNMAHTGTSISSGVAFFQNLLRSTENMFAVDSKASAHLSVTDGYVSIRNTGNLSVVTVTEKLVKNRRPSSNGVEFSIPTNLLDVIDGEYVVKGTQLSKGVLSPNKYGSNLKGELYMNPIDLVKIRMLIMIKLYFDIFATNRLDIHARHFEVFAKLQNNDLMMLSNKLKLNSLGELETFERTDGMPNLSKVTYPKILKMSEEELKQCKFYHKLLGQGEVILKNGGVLTLLSFEQICKYGSTLAFSKYKGKEKAMMGKLAIGQNLEYPELPKVLTKKSKYLRTPITAEPSRLDEFEDIKLDAIEVEEFIEDVNDNSSNLDDIDLSSLCEDLGIGSLDDLDTFGKSNEDNEDLSFNEEDLFIEDDDFLMEDIKTISPNISNENQIYLEDEEIEIEDVEVEKLNSLDNF